LIDIKTEGAAVESGGYYQHAAGNQPDLAAITYQDHLLPLVEETRPRNSPNTETTVEKGQKSSKEGTEEIRLSGHGASTGSPLSTVNLKRQSLKTNSTLVAAGASGPSKLSNVSPHKHAETFGQKELFTPLAIGGIVGHTSLQTYQDLQIGGSNQNGSRLVRKE
jgi:hypothetical protein